MARGAHSPAPTLPKVSFVKVEDDFSKKAAGVHDQQQRSYGYNDFADFQRPDAYIHYIEPLEVELAKQVEYDMDEQDQDWLDNLNTERRAAGLDRISYETFEIVMDRLEKEWFHLTKDIPKPDMVMPSEDSTCAICDDSEGENTNAIVFCDGCNLAVHQDCYGVPYIPEGQWLCRKCTVSPEIPVNCELCPNEGGAFKQTAHGDWVHLLCAIWVPETRVANDVFMEPITGMERISKQRWKLKCQVCDIRQGACIQCSKTSCFLAFHATCARKEKLLMPMKATSGSEPPTLQCFCEKHLPREQAEARAVALAAEEEDATTEHPSSPKSSKTARAYAKTYKLGPPPVPAIIVSQILQYIHKIIVRKKPEFVEMVARYWSLKREARRGAPLLKRLHLEPWTVSAAIRNQTDEEKTKKLEHMRRLRQDLEQVRMLAELCRKRESRKLTQAEIVRDLLSRALLPHEPSLREVFRQITQNDRYDFFKNPVSRTDVPDYFDIVKRPMNWAAIEAKLGRHEYWDLQAFKDDILLVLDNAMLYNNPGTPYFKAAQRIKAVSEPILASLNTLVPPRPQLNADGSVVSAAEGTEGESTVDKMDEASQHRHIPIGDLEPPYPVLDFFVSNEIKEESEFILNEAPIVSILKYEFGELKPLPPPPPPKPKRDRKADREKKRLEREAQRLDAAPGFRALRTRRGTAAVAAFEAEANELQGEASTSAATSAIPIPVPVEGQLPESQPQEQQPQGQQPQEQQPQEQQPQEQQPREQQPQEQQPQEQQPPEQQPSEQQPQDLAPPIHPAAVKKGKKRAAPVLLGHAEPPMVKEVDPQASFKMFDQGWILPPDQKRGGRSGVERGPVPPPRKKLKTGATSGVKIRLPAMSPMTERAPSTRPVEDLNANMSVNTDALSAAETSTSVFVPPNDVPETPMLVDNVPAATEKSEAVEVGPLSADTVVEPVATTDVPEPAVDTAPSEVPAEMTSIATLPAPTSVPSRGNSPPADVQAVGEDVPPTPALDVNPAPTTLPVEPVTDETVNIPSVPADVPAPSIDVPVPTIDVPQVVRSYTLEPNEKFAQDVDGTIIIEELDTPQTRKAKYLRRRARLNAEPASDAHTATEPATRQPIAGPSKLPAAVEESELSSLSDSDDETARPKKTRRKKRSRSSMPIRVKKPLPNLPGKLEDGKVLEAGTLVWAQAPSYPWWAAVVFEPDDPEVPPLVLESKKLPAARRATHLVRFYDNGKTWQWLPTDKLRLLGEDKALDQLLLVQSFKTTKLEMDCHASYSEALKEMETEIDDGERHDSDGARHESP